MNALKKARTAYAPSQSAVRTPRSIEAQLLGRANAQLRNANSFPATAEAVHQNRRIWTSLAASVADEANKLPQQIRAQIFYLAEFTEHHSKRVLNGEADVSPLMAINSAILNGLSGQVAR